MRYRYWALALLGTILFVPFLGARSFWYPDEPDLAEATQAMIVSGDWVLPTANGEPFVDYPPLLYWAAGVTSGVFGGMSEFGFRFPLALSGILTVLVTALVASRWFGPVAGFWSGLLLLTFHKFALQAVSYRPDALFAATITAGILLYASGAGATGGGLRRVGGFALLGLAMLAKGPLGLLLPGLVLLLWHASRRQWRRALALAPLSLVSLAVYLPWFVACARAMGAESILWELWAQNVLRFFGGARGHEQPFLYYFTHFWVNLWPWSWLFPVSLIWIWRGSLRQDRNVQLLLWWLGTFLVFLSMAATKRHVYLLPAYPAVAMLMGPWVARWTEPAERGDAPYGARAIGAWALAMAVVSASLGVLFLALAVGGTSVIEIVRPDAEAWPVITHLRVPAFIVGSVLLGSVWFLGNSWRRRDRAASLSAVAMTYGLLYVLSQALVMPAFEPLKTFRPQSQWILARVPGGEPTALLDLNGYAERRRAAFAYYLGAPMGKLETRGDVEGFFAEHPGSLVLIEERSWGRVAPTDGIWERRVERELEASGETYRVLRGPGWP